VLFDKIAIALISPLGTSLFLWILALMLIYARFIRLGAVTSFLGTGWLLLWSMPFASAWLVSSIENDYPPTPIDLIPERQAIVVLGGGITASGLGNDVGQPFNLGDASDRVWLGSKLYHLGKAPLLVFSGGGRPGQSEAESMAAFTKDLGVPSDVILLENMSRNTRENASFSAELLHDKGVSAILLVTSAVHMKRAYFHFDAQGFNVTPVATDYNGPSLSLLYCCIPDSRALDSSSKAFKEILANLIYSTMFH
jgi:uncharacterized SAM-binding protein YcdF (DUF218 family)